MWTAMLLAIVLGPATWLITEFIGRPVRRFFDLRGEIIRQMAQCNNVMARQQEDDAYGTRVNIDISEEEEHRLKNAEQIFRDLASQMRSFALNETGAVWLVKLRYDLQKASNALFRVSNKIGTYGHERHLGLTQVQETLRFTL
jgi:hypothetical protein